MTKVELINDVVYEMAPSLTAEQQDRLKITMLVKMQNYEVTELVASVPMVVEKDNAWLLKRYMIDGIAAGTKESSLKQVAYAVKTLLQESGKNYRDIIGQDITDYLAIKQYRDKISPNYKASLYRWFSTFFSWAYRKHHISADIMLDVDRVRPVQKKKDRLTDEEIETIREQLKTPRERALFELMISTGMRVGEIKNVNITDIDFHRRRIIVYGEKTDTYRTGMLNIKVVRALREYIGNRTEGPLFITERRPCNRLSIESLEQIAKTIAKRAGVVRLAATVHVYRKTFASITYRRTRNILLVSKLLGHAKVDTTIKYYLVDDIEDMQHEFDRAS